MTFELFGELQRTAALHTELYMDSKNYFANFHQLTS